MLIQEIEANLSQFIPPGQVSNIKMKKHLAKRKHVKDSDENSSIDSDKCFIVNDDNREIGDSDESNESEQCSEIENEDKQCEEFASEVTLNEKMKRNNKFFQKNLFKFAFFIEFNSIKCYF